VRSGFAHTGLDFAPLRLGFADRLFAAKPVSAFAGHALKKPARSGKTGAFARHPEFVHVRAKAH
jgi:hypothetical protein